MYSTYTYTYIRIHMTIHTQIDIHTYVVGLCIFRLMYKRAESKYGGACSQWVSSPTAKAKKETCRKRIHKTYIKVAHIHKMMCVYVYRYVLYVWEYTTHSYIYLYECVQHTGWLLQPEDRYKDRQTDGWTDGQPDCHGTIHSTSQPAHDSKQVRQVKNTQLGSAKQPKSVINFQLATRLFVGLSTCVLYPSICNT